MKAKTKQKKQNSMDDNDQDLFYYNDDNDIREVAEELIGKSYREFGLDSQQYTSGGLYD